MEEEDLHLPGRGKGPPPREGEERRGREGRREEEEEGTEGQAHDSVIKIK